MVSINKLLKRKETYLMNYHEMCLELIHLIQQDGQQPHHQIHLHQLDYDDKGIV